MGFASGCPTVALWASPLLAEVLAIAVVGGGVPPLLPPQAATTAAAVAITATHDLSESFGMESPCDSRD